MNPLLKSFNPIAINELIDKCCLLTSQEERMIHELYHYTDQKNISSIFLNGKIDLWHMKHSNDLQEHSINEIMNYYHTALNSIDIDKASNIYNILKAIKITDDYMFYGCYTHENKGVAYICCFSLESNSRYLIDKTKERNAEYVSKLTFSAINVFEERNKSFNHYKHLFQKVVYKDSEKIERIKLFLSGLLEYSMNERTIQFCVQTFLNICRFSFKPIKYEKENEIRSLIILRKEESDILENECIAKKTPIHFSLYFEEFDFLDNYSEYYLK